MVLTSRLGAYISESGYGNFYANDNNNDDTTDYFTPCACMRAGKLTTLKLGSGRVDGRGWLNNTPSLLSHIVACSYIPIIRI